MWKFTDQTNTIVQRTFPDGRSESCLVTREDVQEWITAGNVPEPADEPVVSAEQVRCARDKILAESDWTMLPDAPLTPEQVEAWKVYRQALRDVPQQECFPEAVDWPTAPGE